MSNLWTRNDRIVTNASGNPLLCDECPCGGDIELCNYADFVSNRVFVALSSACAALNGQTIQFDFAAYIGPGTDSARFDAANPITLGSCSFNASVIFDCTPNNVYLSLRNPTTNEQCLQISFGSFKTGSTSLLPLSGSGNFVGNGSCTCCGHLVSVSGTLSE